LTAAEPQAPAVRHRGEAGIGTPRRRGRFPLFL